MSASHDLVVSWAQQSPIDLEPAIYTEELVPLLFDYKKPTYGHFDGDDFVIDSVPPPYLYIGAKSYPLKKIHFHVPAEHVVNGSCEECEIHLVHADPDFPSKSPSLFWAVGVFVNFKDVGEGAPPAESLMKSLKGVFKPVDPTVTDEENPPEDTPPDGHHSVDLPTLIPEPNFWNHYWRYEGSLTTPLFKRPYELPSWPPFAEIVSWIVLKNIITIETERDLSEIKKSPHARELQPRNRRFVLRNFRLGGKNG